MTDAKFEKVTRSDKALYGPRKLLLCGFPSAAQSKFDTVLEFSGLSSVPKVWVSEDQAEVVLSELLELGDAAGAGVSSSLPRAIIVAGIAEKEMIGLMTTCKKAGMTQALWATLTPTSENWTIRQLLMELAAEREAMQRKK